MKKYNGHKYYKSNNSPGSYYYKIKGIVVCPASFKLINRKEEIYMICDYIFIGNNGKYKLFKDYFIYSSAFDFETNKSIEKITKEEYEEIQSKL